MSRKMTYREKVAVHIADLVNQRAIEDVIHFTQLSNLPGILQYGLLSRFDLQRTDVSHDALTSDAVRLDDNEVAVSVSVSCFYPNMFDAKRHRSGGKPWVILGLNPSLLWELNCLFFAHSAASSNTKYERHVGARNSDDAFERLFQDHAISQDERIPSYRETRGLPISFPTYPDSEVQVLQPIHAGYLQGVWVESSDDEAKVLRMLEDFGRVDCEIFVAPFKPRHSYQQTRWG